MLPKLFVEIKFRIQVEIQRLIQRLQQLFSKNQIKSKLEEQIVYFKGELFSFRIQIPEFKTLL